MTYVTNGSSGLIKAGTALPRACEIWVFPNQAPAESRPPTTANIYGLDTMALTEKQEETGQVCEKQPGKKNRGR